MKQGEAKFLYFFFRREYKYIIRNKHGDLGSKRGERKNETMPEWSLCIEALTQCTHTPMPRVYKNSVAYPASFHSAGDSAYKNR